MSRKSSATFWQKSKTSSKAGFDRLWGYADKLGDPVNKLSHKLGSEAFWPTTLDKESEKAARILRSFCSKSLVRVVARALRAYAWSGADTRGSLLEQKITRRV